MMNVILVSLLWVVFTSWLGGFDVVRVTGPSARNCHCAGRLWFLVQLHTIDVAGRSLTRLRRSQCDSSWLSDAGKGMVLDALQVGFVFTELACGVRLERGVRTAPVRVLVVLACGGYYSPFGW